MSRIRLNLGRQQPFIDRVLGGWRFWIIYNSDVSAGTYYEIWDNGEINLVSISANQTEDIIYVRQADKTKE
jgi:hypothetical protein